MSVSEDEPGAAGGGSVRRRRRRWSEAQKRQIVAETHEPGVSVPMVAQRYNLNANQVFRWRRLFRAPAGDVGVGRFVPIVVEAARGPGVGKGRPFMRAVIVAAILFAIAGPAAAEEPTALDRLELWNECAPVDLGVLVQDADDEIGLTERVVMSTALTRLSFARLYGSNPDDTAPARLAVFVNIVGDAFAVDVHLFKRVMDVKSGLHGLATTWWRGGTGTPGDDANAYILGSVARYVDIFIAEYLRVNATACAKR